MLSKYIYISQLANAEPLSSIEVKHWQAEIGMYTRYLSTIHNCVNHVCLIFMVSSFQIYIYLPTIRALIMKIHSGSKRVKCYRITLSVDPKCGSHPLNILEPFSCIPIDFIDSSYDLFCFCFLGCNHLYLCMLHSLVCLWLVLAFHYVQFSVHFYLWWPIKCILFRPYYSPVFFFHIPIYLNL